MKLPPYDFYPSISDEKIVLRQILASDIQDVIELSFYNSIQAKTIEEATEMQKKIDIDYESGNSIHWGIVEKSTNNIVVTCGYYRGLDKGIGELGCVLLPQYRGKGFMSLAMQLALNFGLDTIGIKCVKAITTKQNEKAKQLLKRLNFIKIANLQDNEIEYELKLKV
ncbi:GNAT family N-acetyltransferase [Flavobacterium sp. ZS1P70]|uniref:GNAT family N-acetyltransferase n=1 Tax=Flavobacterium zhoui TaxID=3230414 RepID=A0ABW6I1G7_9FLAO